MKQPLTVNKLIAEAKKLIHNRYEPNVHHVATVLKCGEMLYYGLHLDSHGIDACGEPSALSAACVAGQTRFDLIVSVHWTGCKDDEPTIIAPCGNCAQLLLNIAPEVEVIVPHATGFGHARARPAQLLPYAYTKPA